MMEFLTAGNIAGTTGTEFTRDKRVFWLEERISLTGVKENHVRNPHEQGIHIRKQQAVLLQHVSADAENVNLFTDFNSQTVKTECWIIHGLEPEQAAVLQKERKNARHSKSR